MSLSKQSRESLLDAILSITDSFGKQENTTVTDLYFQVDKSSGVITIYNDDDHELANAQIAEWEAGAQEQNPVNIEKTLRTELVQMQKVGLFDKMNILKPYSCTLVDESKETIVDLLYIDDDTLILDSELLQGLDKEMDDFLKYLLEE